MNDTGEGAFVGERGAQTAKTGIPAQGVCPTCHRPLPANPLNDPDSPQVQAALERRCDQCGAPAGQLCVKRGGFRDDLKARLIHIGRQEKP